MSTGRLCKENSIPPCNWNFGSKTINPYSCLRCRPSYSSDYHRQGHRLLTTQTRFYPRDEASSLAYQHLIVFSLYKKQTFNPNDPSGYSSRARVSKLYPLGPINCNCPHAHSHSRTLTHTYTQKKHGHHPGSIITWRKRGKTQQSSIADIVSTDSTSPSPKCMHRFPANLVSAEASLSTRIRRIGEASKDSMRSSRHGLM